MKISKIKISNFRSIINLEILIDNSNNFICFCGQNNVGKTNVINALNLFFDLSEYIPEKDCPNHKYYGTRGGAYQPKVEIEFIDESDKFYISKDWNKKLKNPEEDLLYTISGMKNGKAFFSSEKAIINFVSKIHFFSLQSINISFPEAIKYIMNNDVIDMETGKSRLSGKKGEMKEKIESVLENLNEILGTLSNDISPMLNRYKEGWGVAFDLPTQVNTFRDLMIGETDFYIKDSSDSKAIDAKGSGLQRLCHILMYFRIIQKLNEKHQKTIICIDEPDVYLHSGLQKKLMEDIKDKCLQNQIFITTHSPIFIDTVKLSNVFLLDQSIEPKEYVRGRRKSEPNKKYNAIKTHLVDFKESNGISTLKNYLGIETKDNLFFDKYNILVEGEEDKIYLTKLLKHFNLNVPSIIACHGADNIEKYLSFYNSMVENIDTKISVLIILDNDNKGREVSKKIKASNYDKIKLQKKFIISFSGFSPELDQNGNCNANIEIEDFINPKILCLLCNKIIKKKNLNEFKIKDIKKISNDILKPAFQHNGVLNLLENKKNELNPEKGQNLVINGNGINGVKSGIANMFNDLDMNIIEELGKETDENNQHIISFLKSISECF